MERTYSTRSCAHEARVEANDRWAERPSLWKTHEKTDTRRERMLSVQIASQKTLLFLFPAFAGGVLSYLWTGLSEGALCEHRVPVWVMGVFLIQQKQQRKVRAFRPFRAAHAVRLYCVRPNRRTFFVFGRTQKNRQTRKTRGKPVFAGDGI